MRLVLLETPFRAPTPALFERNIAFARACMRDCILMHGEAPFASHLLYAQEGILDDCKFEERIIGIQNGFAWAEAAAVASVFYLDYGMSEGMRAGQHEARRVGRELVFRFLDKSRAHAGLNHDLGVKA